MKWPFSPPEKETGKPRLILPSALHVNNRYHEVETAKLLADIVEKVKAIGGLYRWRKYQAPSVIVRWDKETHQFIKVELGYWLAERFSLSDSVGEFLHPLPVVTSRIYEELLKGHTLEDVGWQVTADWRRQGK